MKIFIASDHAGVPLKSQLVTEIKNNSNHDIVDLGPFNHDSVDYPDYADLLCKKIKETPDSQGILICGSGQGMVMRANRYNFIRAALCWNTEVAQLSREHNNANVLCMPGRMISFDLASEITRKFLMTSFSGGRHAARVDKLGQPVS